MKKTEKLTIKKVTLRDLDDQVLQEVAGGAATVKGATCSNTICETNCHAFSCRPGQTC